MNVMEIAITKHLLDEIEYNIRFVLTGQVMLDEAKLNHPSLIRQMDQVNYKTILDLTFKQLWLHVLDICGYLQLTYCTRDLFPHLNLILILIYITEVSLQCALRSKIQHLQRDLHL